MIVSPANRRNNRGDSPTTVKAKPYGWSANYFPRRKVAAPRGNQNNCLPSLDCGSPFKASHSFSFRARQDASSFN